MKKRLFCIITIIAWITVIFPLNIFAGGSVTLNAIPEKHPGDGVTISGTTVLDEVTVKVLRPNSTVLYVEVLDGGSFSDTFTLPGDTALGAYTVVAGKGTDMAAGTFTVTKSDDGSGDDEDSENSGDNEDKGDGSPTPTASPAAGEPEIRVLDNRTAMAVTRPSLDKEKDAAVSAVSAELMRKALGLAKTASDGIRRVMFEIPEIEGADNYTLRLPTSALSSGEGDTRIKIAAPLGTLSLPGNMFDGGGLTGEEEIELTIGRADTAGLAEDIRRQIGERPVIELTAEAGGRVIDWNNPDAPVTVSIPYTPTEEELKDPEHIVVWYIDGQGNVIPVPNGRYDPAAGEVTFTITHFSKYAAAFVKKTFADIQGYAWAKKEIEVLASKGIIEGMSASSYGPGSNITRADFVTLLVRALELKASFEGNFDDVKASDYYYGAVGTAKKLGIIKGVGNNKFDPRAGITREDMMVMAAGAMEAAGKIKDDADISVLSAYTDSASVSSYAAASVAALIKNGIIKGDDKLINPCGNTTRAETAVVIYRIYNK